MKRYDYSDGCMLEVDDGEYVKYSSAEEWRIRAGRLTLNIIELGQQNRELLEQVRQLKGESE